MQQLLENDEKQHNVTESAIELLEHKGKASKAKSDILSPKELSDLNACEITISTGAKVFLEVGKALMEIRDRRLYRQQYTTFEEYCSQKWDICRSHAYRLIQSVKTLDALSPIGDKDAVLPSNEAQMRPLKNLKPQDAKLVWDSAIEQAGDKPVTAAIVEEVVQKLKPRTDAKSRMVDKKETIPVLKADCSGIPPDDKAFQEMDSALTYLRGINKKNVDAAMKRKWEPVLKQVIQTMKALGL